jgi:ADP-ribose pyrophosphatase YjhB (NUDIX family)
VSAAAVREAREESGLHIAVHGLVDVYSYAGRTPIILVYAATRVSGELQVDEEGLEARWFAAADVPWTELAFKSTYEGMRDYFAGRLYRLRTGG